MTIRELSKYYKIKQEIKQIETNIHELEETVISASKITGMPFFKKDNTSPTEKIAIKLAHLKSKLLIKTEKLLDEAQKIEKFLDTVEDPDISIIIRERFLHCKTWQQVADIIITDRTTPYYRLKKYLKETEQVNKYYVEEKKED